MNSTKLYICSFITKFLPETRAFRLKRGLFRWAGAKIGHNVRICSSAIIIGSGELEIGDSTWIGHRVMLVASSSIKIGKNVDVAPNVFIGNGTHEVTPDGERIADIEVTKDVVIGDGCWLCANSAILPGVTIGKKCVVAAGAVVTKSFDDLKLIAGIPAEAKKGLCQKKK